MKDGKKPKNSLIAKYDRCEGGYLVLRLTDGQEIFWPKNQSPKELEQGKEIHLLLRTEEEISKENKDLAKNILEQILNGTKEN